MFIHTWAGLEFSMAYHCQNFRILRLKVFEDVFLNEKIFEPYRIGNL